jgi:hypothetical protein
MVLGVQRVAYAHHILAKLVQTRRSPVKRLLQVPLHRWQIPHAAEADGDLDHGQLVEQGHFVALHLDQLDAQRLRLGAVIGAHFRHGGA